jgi:hypothetical protein
VIFQTLLNKVQNHERGGLLEPEVEFADEIYVELVARERAVSRADPEGTLWVDRRAQGLQWAAGPAEPTSDGVVPLLSEFVEARREHELITNEGEERIEVVGP